MEKETVNHPDHYKKGDRIECIELLDIITKGYEGIAAFDIGQVKYLYRAGSKFNDPKQKAKKALEDVNKCFNPFNQVFGFNTTLCKILYCKKLESANRIPCNFF